MTVLDDMIASLEAKLPPEAPLTEEDLARICNLDLTSCDFVGDSGCVDPDCWRCHSPLAPQNLRTLAENLATAALLCLAWELRQSCPTWRPGGGELPAELPTLTREALGSPRIGAFLRRSR